MKNYLNWLAESITPEKMEEIAARVSKELEPKFKLEIFAVPGFETFIRHEEPLQTSILFTTKNLQTFVFNYTVSNGRLYSVDFWKSDEVDPSATLYVKDMTEDEVLQVIPHLSEKPVPGVSVNGILADSKKKRWGDHLKEDQSGGAPETNAIITAPKDVITQDANVMKANSKIEEYEFSDPDTVFEDLKNYVNMVIDKTQPSLVLTGTPGVGKTFLVTKELKEHKLEKGKDYVHIKGRSTAAGMFISLWQNKDKIVVFDDCDSIFGSEDAVNILSGALDSYEEREISWLVGRPLKSPTGEQIPSTFTFTGAVIFISNLPQKKIEGKLKSRSFVLEVALSQEDMIKRMKKLLPEMEMSIPMPLKQEAMGYIEEFSKTRKDLELNLRTLIKAIRILKSVDSISVAKRLIIQQCSYR